MRTSTTQSLAAGFLGVLIGVVQVVGFAQSSNSEVGVWKLNLAKSEYNDRPAPRATPSESRRQVQASRPPLTSCCGRYSDSRRVHRQL